MGDTVTALFRTSPPRELVEQILVALGFRGLEDLRWFSKDELTVETQDEWLPLLEPYYLPCKAERFLYRGRLDGQDCVTILRHLLRQHGCDLATVERTYKGKKQPLYQLRSAGAGWPTGAPSLQIDFL